MQQPQPQPQIPQNNLSREQETPEFILNKLDTILEQSPNSIQKYLRKRQIDLATINFDRNPLIIGIREECPISKLHALIKNFSSIKKKRRIKDTDIEIIKFEIDLNKQLIQVLKKNSLTALKQFLENECIDLNFFKNDNNPLIYAIKNGLSYEIIEFLLQHNISLNFYQWNGSTPLAEAAMTNNKRVFELLLEKGADVNYLNYTKETPLIYLAKKGSLTKYYLSKFLECNVKVNFKDKYNNTILMYLSKLNKLDLLNFILTDFVFNPSLLVHLIMLGRHRVPVEDEPFLYLLHKGYTKIDVDTMDEKQNTPLMYACQRGFFSIVYTLLQYKADLNRDNYLNDRPLFFACSHNHYAIAKLLIDTHRVEMNHRNKNGDTELAVACTTDNAQIVELLINHQSDVNYINNKGNYPIHIATLNNKLNALKALHKHGADIHTDNVVGNQCFTLASINGYVDIMNYLISLKVDYNHVNYSGNSALHQCCILQKQEMVDYILELENVEMDVPNSYGFTPFLIACKMNSIELAKSFMNHPRASTINYNIKSNSSEFPLYYATCSKNVELIKLLLDRQVDMYNERDNGGYDCYTAFMMACSYFSEITPLFLDYGIDVNRPNSLGIYPLGIVCKEENLEEARLLLAHGANPNVQSKGLTPLAYTCINNSFAIAKELISYGADVNLETNEGIHPLFFLMNETRKRNNEFIQYLIDQGADLYCKDDYGNSLLYVLKNSNKVDKEEVYDTLVAAYKQRQDYRERCPDTTSFIETYDTYHKVMTLLQENKNKKIIIETHKSAPKETTLPKEKEEEGKEEKKKHQEQLKLECLSLLSPLEVPESEPDMDTKVVEKDPSNPPLLLPSSSSSTLNNETVNANAGADTNANGNDDINGDANANANANGDDDDDANDVADVVDIVDTDVNNDVNEDNIDDNDGINDENDDVDDDVSEEGVTDNDDTDDLNILNSTPVRITQEELNRTFLQAVSFGKYEEVEELLLRFPSIDINVRETNGDTPLIIACQTGKADIAMLLLRYNADPNLICECGNTALYVATFSYARHCSIELIQSLLDHGANPNVLSQYCLTPLMVACKDNLVNVATLLLKYKANPNFQDYDGNSALYFMACNLDGQYTLKTFLSHNNVNINTSTKNGYTPLMIACNKRYLTAAKILLEANADICAKNYYGQTALHLACNHYINDIFNHLHSHPQKIDLLQEDIQGFSPYHLMKLNGTTQFFNTLITYEIDYLQKMIYYYRHYSCKEDLPVEAKNYMGEEAFETFNSLQPSHAATLATLQKKWDYIQKERRDLDWYLAFKETYIQNNYTLNWWELTKEDLDRLMIYAGIFQDVKIIFQLVTLSHMSEELNISVDIDINAKDQDGYTALHYICSSERFNRDTINTLVKFLLKQPTINKNAQSGYGYTPLMLACYHSNKTVAKMLMEQGVDVNLTTVPQHQTALMLACQSRNVFIVKKLIECRADPDVQDNIYGDTALTLVSKYYQSYNIIRVLTEQGQANVNISNFKGETPLLLSCQTNNVEHVKILVEHGAEVNRKAKERKPRTTTQQPQLIGLPEQHQTIGQCQTPLLSVINNFNYYLGQYLLEHGADIRLSNDQGESPLILSCKLYNKYSSELLLQHGADPDACDRKGASAKSVIAQNHFNYIIGLN